MIEINKNEHEQSDQQTKNPKIKNDLTTFFAEAHFNKNLIEKIINGLCKEEITCELLLNSVNIKINLLI